MEDVEKRVLVNAAMVELEKATNDDLCVLMSAVVSSWHRRGMLCEGCAQHILMRFLECDRREDVRHEATAVVRLRLYLPCPICGNVDGNHRDAIPIPSGVVTGTMYCSHVAPRGQMSRPILYTVVPGVDGSFKIEYTWKEEAEGEK